MFKVNILKPPRKIEEALSRIGVSPEDSNTLYTSVVLIHNKQTNVSYIAHFKEALALIHNTSNFVMDKESEAILNNVVMMLQNWGMITLSQDTKLTFNNEFKVKVLKKIDLEEDSPDKWAVIRKFKMTLPKLQRLIELLGTNHE